MENNKFKYFRESNEHLVYEEDLSARSQRAFEKSEADKKQSEYSQWVEAEIAKFSDAELPDHLLVGSAQDKYNYKLKVITERRGET
jgi:hypothetical protein